MNCDRNTPCLIAQIMRVIPTLAPIALIAAIALTACQPQPSSTADPNRTTAPTTPEATSPPEPQTVALTPLSPDNPDADVQEIVDRYLDKLTALGFDRTQQSVWVQTNDRLLAQWQGTQRLPAASVTKIATTLTALRVLGADHRFTTEVGIIGTVADGVLTGDLVVVGDRDPMLVWEDAIAIGNALNAQGIRQVTGDLVVVGDLLMNFEADTATAAELLAIGLDASRWTDEARSQHATLEPGTPEPQVAIGGIVRTAPLNAKPANLQPLLTYASRPLVELLDQMNRYSNNIIAQSLADTAGGAIALEREVIATTGIDPNEIQLMNGSGLGRENQLSPRAAVMMFRAIQRELAPEGLTVADVVAVAGVDAGILQARPLPKQVVLKSGSLDAVSTIAGGIPTKNGVIWLAVMNGGGDTEALRSAQESLIAELEAYGGKTEAIAPELTPTPDRDLSPSLTLIQTPSP
ncbi:MAG: D-alanyl-D-alanine carboxypeptidase [Coleofasciculaceae cyanobacterium RL_1_1]|nr:D-alanyl-D-alanine carboxypeptidase [Coleofasciculaceae cyanobacterium RL_1_1]